MRSGPNSGAAPDTDLHERMAQAELGAAVGRALTSDAPLALQLQRCAEALVHHLAAAFARIWTLDGTGELLRLRASAGLYTHLDGDHSRVPVGSFKIGRIARSRTPHLTNVVIGDPEVHEQAWAAREGMVAFAGYPLVVGDRLMGVMALFARHALPRSTLDALAAIADTIALGVARAEVDAERDALLARERAAREELETIHRVGQVLAAELELETLVQAVTDAATELTGARFGAFFYNVQDERGESYTLYTIAGVPREAFAGFPMPRNTAVFGPTFRGEGVVRLDDVTADPRYGRNSPYAGMPERHLPVVSYLAVPVVSRFGAVLGGLFFGHPEAGVFDERAERVVSGLAGQAAIALDNARLFRQAQQSVRLRDHFLATVAHDLNSPLTILRGQAQLVRRRLDRQPVAPDERLTNSLDQIDRTVTRMAGMIGELSDLSQLAAGQALVLTRRPTDLVALARQVVAEYQRPDGRHRLRLQADTATLIGTWDAARLERALDNLVGNAVKYSPAGGDIVVTAARAGEDDQTWAVIEVRDSGLGIPATDLARIFEPFYRGGNVAAQIRGTGLGLAGTQRVVEEHGGTISVASRQGAGSTFTIRLPLLDQSAAAPATSLAPDSWSTLGQ